MSVNSIIVKKWNSTYGLPEIKKYFKNYEQLLRWYPKGDYKKRGVIKIPILDKQLKNKINLLTNKLLKDKKGIKLESVKDGGKYDDYIKASLLLEYDEKKSKYTNKIKTQIFINNEEKKGFEVEDLNKILKEGSETKLIIKPKNSWEFGKFCGVKWIILSINIKKNKKNFLIS